MKYQRYIQDFKSLYEDLLSFIDDNECNDAFPTISQKINDMGIKSDKIELEHFLRIVVSISNNHHRTNNFFNKIEQILDLLETQIKQTFSNLNLFNFFKKNKQILLFLFEKEIITLDDNIIEKTKLCLNKFSESDIRNAFNFIEDISLFIKDI